MINLKKKKRNLKVLIAIGGWNEGSEKYSRMAMTEMSRKKFIDSAVAFTRYAKLLICYLKKKNSCFIWCCCHLVPMDLMD